MWNVEWSVSGHKHKKVFKKYEEALRYLEETIKIFGREWHIKISMWESD